MSFGRGVHIFFAESHSGRQSLLGPQHCDSASHAITTMTSTQTKGATTTNTSEGTLLGPWHSKGFISPRR